MILTKDAIKKHLVTDDLKWFLYASLEVQKATWEKPFEYIDPYTKEKKIAHGAVIQELQSLLDEVEL